MAETTKIAWTDATWNPWVGCTKVGPGCDHCYAENVNQRFSGGVNWGTGAPRRRTSEAYWNAPRKWNRYRAEGRVWLKRPMEDRYPPRPGTPVPLWVFCASQADVFDNEVDPAWRADLWRLIRDTPNLRWQLVTKRVGNVTKMLPPDWWRHTERLASPSPEANAYQHVGIIATMVNQEEWNRDGWKLIQLKQEYGVRWIGASVEPQLGPITMIGLPHLNWIICGGESIQRGQARDFDLHWARSLRDQCAAASVPFFMKQVGSRPVVDTSYGMDCFDRLTLADRAGADPTEWPADLRVRQMPRIYDEGPNNDDKRNILSASMARGLAPQ